MQRVRITVPAGVQPGQNFSVTYQGNKFNVACPANSHAGQQILIDIPQVAPAPIPQAQAAAQGRNLMQQAYQQPGASNQAPQPQYAAPPAAAPGTYPPPNSRSTAAAPPLAQPAPQQRQQQQQPPSSSSSGQIVVVQIPKGISSGKDFIVEHGGREYTITCPPGVSAGDDIEVEL